MMLKKRSCSSSVVVNQTKGVLKSTLCVGKPCSLLWVVGGREGSEDMNSTEFISHSALRKELRLNIYEYF